LQATKTVMTLRTLLVGIASPLIAVGRPLAAAMAALLPCRYWQVLYRLPIRAMSLPSAIATVLIGLVAGGRGFMAYATLAAEAASQAALEAAARQTSGAASSGEPITTLTPQLVSVASVVAFTLFTPLGLLATYLTVSGLLRVAAVVTDHPAGDPFMTGLDEMARAVWRRVRASRAAKRRLSDEGPETADRLFMGEGVGLDGVDYAVVASRRKPDWTSGTIVVTPDGWYRIGEPFDARLPYGLRTIYPLTRLETSEVLRRAVQYELPPLQRGPGRIERS
jgi:hypothetical protein